MENPVCKQFHSPTHSKFRGNLKKTPGKVPFWKLSHYWCKNSIDIVTYS